MSHLLTSSPGTRSVSTLTPAQLARKRANDREAQRAIRARTKEHIERLESEIDELRGMQNRDQAVQELLRRNRALEDELNRLRESMGLPSSSPYSNNNKTIYDDNMSPGGSAIPSPRTSPFPAGDYAPASNQQLHDYNHAAAAGYVPFPANCETWAATIPAATVPSNVSSPSSSSVGAEDFTTAAPGGQYLPTSAPMIPSPNLNGHLRVGEEIKMEYEDGNDHGFPLDRSPSISRSNSNSNNGTPSLPTMGFHALMPHQMPHQAAHQTAPWGMYPMYYPVQSPVH
jgi:hypothetical protein